MKTSPRVVLQVLLAHSGGVAGAELLGLFDPGDALLVGELIHHLFFAMTDDDQHASHPASKQASSTYAEHRLAADFVQHLGPPRLHARALPGGEDDRSQ